MNPLSAGFLAPPQEQLSPWERVIQAAIDVADCDSEDDRAWDHAVDCLRKACVRYAKSIGWSPAAAGVELAMDKTIEVFEAFAELPVPKELTILPAIVAAAHADGCPATHEGPCICKPLLHIQPYAGFPSDTLVDGVGDGTKTVFCGTAPRFTMSYVDRHLFEIIRNVGAGIVHITSDDKDVASIEGPDTPPTPARTITISHLDRNLREVVRTLAERVGLTSRGRQVAVLAPTGGAA